MNVCTSAEDKSRGLQVSSSSVHRGGLSVDQGLWVSLLLLPVQEEFPQSSHGQFLSTAGLLTSSDCPNVEEASVLTNCPPSPASQEFIDS